MNYEEFKDKGPHKDLEDMAVVYRFVVGDTENGRGSILITNQLLDSYGINWMPYVRNIRTTMHLQSRLG